MSPYPKCMRSSAHPGVHPQCRGLLCMEGRMSSCLERACADLLTCDNSNTALGCCAGRVTTRRLSGAPRLL